MRLQPHSMHSASANGTLHHGERIGCTRTSTARAGRCAASDDTRSGTRSRLRMRPPDAATANARPSGSAPARSGDVIGCQHDGVRPQPAARDGHHVLASRCRRPFALEHTRFDRRPQPQRVVDVPIGSDDTCADPRHGPLRCDGQLRRAKRRPDTRWPADLYEAGIELYAQSRLGRRRGLRQHGLPKPGEGVLTRCAIPPRIERTRKDDHAISTSHAERDRIPALPHRHERSGCSRQVRDQDLGRSNRRAIGNGEIHWLLGHAFFECHIAKQPGIAAGWTSRCDERHRAASIANEPLQEIDLSRGQVFRAADHDEIVRREIGSRQRVRRRTGTRRCAGGRTLQERQREGRLPFQAAANERRGPRQPRLVDEHAKG